MIIDRQDYLRWAYSDLLSNRERGVLAEYLVGYALDSVDGIRAEWDAYDVETADGIKVEVKASAYLQTWEQAGLSAIRYDIAPKKSWDASTSTHSSLALRSADVYVFCLLKEINRSRVDPLDTDQWSFVVVPTNLIDTTFGAQKTVALSVLERLGEPTLPYERLSAGVRSAALQKSA